MKLGSRPARAVAVALAIGLAGSLSASALAEQTAFHVRPTIKLKRSVGEDKFSGKLRSKEHACEANRKVKLRHRNVSQLSNSSVIAKLRTNGKGKWTFTPKKNQNGDRYATPGNYEIRVGQTRVSTGDGTVTCRRKNSSSLFVG